MKGRIKVGAMCFQDHSFFRWPGPYRNEQDMTFDLSPTLSANGGVEAAADGFGYGVSGQPKGKYGNGSIYVYQTQKETDRG